MKLRIKFALLLQFMIMLYLWCINVNESVVNADNIQTVEELIQNFSSLLLINPFNAKALVIRGMLLESQNKYQLAIADYNTLIETGEKKGYYLRAYSYCRMGKIYFAISDLMQSEIHGIQCTAIPQYVAYIAKRRADIVREIEAEYLRDTLKEKYGNLNTTTPN